MAALISTIVITVLALALGVWAFVIHRSWRALARGIGAGVAFVGVLFLGFTDLVIQGVLGLVNWIQTTVWTQQMTNAAIATGIGAVIVILAGYLPKGSGRAQQAPAAQQVPAGSGRPELTPSKAAAPGRGKQAAHDPEDDEIEALLRARNL
ncbi:MAG: hypothetical protein Q4B08_11330 [Propionibacteriaceae bacterium]|nr:hypothetical protein [Propionibacteriaceae bacterium]